MNELTTLLKKPVFIIVVSFFVSAAISALLAVTLALPGFNGWQKAQASNEELTATVVKVSQNIDLVKGVNTSERESFIKVMGIFYPEVADYLHFATLNEKLAAARGVQVTSFITDRKSVV